VGQIVETNRHDSARSVVILSKGDPGRLQAAARRHGLRVLGTGSSFDEIDALLPDAGELVVDQAAVDVLRDDDEWYRHVAALRVAFDDGDPFADPIPVWGRAAKRAIDVAVAAVGLVVTAPVLAVLAVLIRLDTRGPVLFRQSRVGKDGRRFDVVKLRTMHVDNDDAAHRAYVAQLIQGDAAAAAPGMFKIVDDPRITRVGKHLRRLSLDELPQLINVLRGDMSVVGPRPPLPNEAARFDARMWRRQRVKPGLTGLWQVSGRSTMTWQQMIDLDVHYVDEWTLRLDLGVLWRTPRALLARETA
jgi:lipopolysaccharide/colanic/teichoic acid biosynthesis glycosyltransferase